MMKKAALLLLLIAAGTWLFAQSIGIGTPTPHASAQLDVSSTSKGFLAPRMTLAQRNVIATPANGLIIYQTDNTSGFYYYNGTSWVQLSTGSGSSNWTLFGPTLYNNNVAGAVSIGGFTSLAKFTVLGDVAIYDAQAVLTLRNIGTSGYSAIRFQKPDGVTEFSITQASNRLRLTNGSLVTTAPALAIDDVGNVGIGTINPTAKFHVQSNVMIGVGNPAAGYSLSVNGKVISEEVRVALSGSADWPDYVFEKNYSLKPLSELEKFIRQQKHLPGIPAAVQVKKEGFDLGDMNRRLLEKVEELTLYLIEQDKNLSRLQEMVNAMQIASEKQTVIK